MSFFKKLKGLANKAKDKYAAYEKKKAFNMQINAEKKARDLEKRAVYNKQYNKRLERQIKAQKIIDKTAKLEKSYSQKKKKANLTIRLVWLQLVLVRTVQNQNQKNNQQNNITHLTHIKF